MFRIILCISLLNIAECQTRPAFNQLFPHGTTDGDQTLQGDDLTLDLGREVTFNGKEYTAAHITKDGLVSFGTTVLYTATNLTALSKDPDNDPPFVAPLYYNGQNVSSPNLGKIHYRILRNQSVESISDRLQDIVKASVGVDHFVPDLALIVTWDGVTDSNQVTSGSCTGTTGSLCQTATFQLVLVATRDETFVIIIHTAMNIPAQTYYQAGINIGNGLGWKNLCPGCSLSDLPSKGGYLYRMTKDIPQRSGCSDERMDLQISPTAVMMFGGKLLEISGPCPNANDEIFCKFEAEGIVVKTSGFSDNNMTVKCPVPRLTRRGFISVSVSVDADRTYIGQASIYVVLYGPIPRSIKPVHGWYDVTPDNLKMTWDRTELTLHEDVKVDIKLVGYRETENEIIWKDLAILASNSDNTGSFTFKPNEYNCSLEDCDLFEVGMVEVELPRAIHKMANTRIAMNAGVFPLGWYVNNAMVSKHGTNWPPKLCTKWYEKDKVDMTWMEKLLYCPCNVDQALADFGRWQPDSGCNMFSSSSKNCFYHKGAKHCVRSFQPSSPGAGNQCCYGENGLLSYAGDSYQGSTPDKGHSWGAYPYDKQGYVPAFSHWIDDVVTFYYCCLWTNYSHCDYYMEQRATRDCNGYRPSKAASAFGDPHIMTFDHKLYNFGGKGDYTLLQAKGFILQGKFKVGKQIHADNRQYNATVLTSVALKSATSNKVEVRLASEGLVTGRRLDVFVDGQLELFNSRALAKQDFVGVSVINLGISVDSTNKRHDNFTILLQSGVGVQVAASNGLLHVVVNVPPDFHNQTSGLMGTWNDNMNDDFTTKDGVVIDASSSPSLVYNNFGKTWKVAEAESLFTYHNMADDTFIPIYTEPQIPPGTATDIADVCKGNAQCRFDYIVTGNSDIGLASRLANEWFAELQSFQRLAETCGLLDVPYSKKDNYNYTLGNTVSITGCRNTGTVTGQTTYTCTRKEGTLQWQPTVTAKCGIPTTTKDPGGIPTTTKDPGSTSDATIARISHLAFSVVAFVIVIAMVKES